MAVKVFHSPEQRSMIERLQDDFLSQGRLMELGWMTFKAKVFPDITVEQEYKLKLAYMSGAQHLWGSANNMNLDETRKSLINVELERYADEINEHILRKELPR
jgi:hypothetical protein